MNKERKLARLFSALSDETRIQILNLLNDGELTVNDIRDVIGTSLPAISYQLRILSSADLVKYDKRGRKKFFRIADAHVKKILNQGLVHVGEDLMDEDSDIEILI
ncbi:MAG: winged helix-turn-helix transcriptional regulator [Candidatus Lokiarchaeota archaeon]|nr:winged helix-turn-helix transcriptional regulator [Candidatus Lokiarchaeota archaeon]